MPVKEEHIAKCFSALSTLKKTFRSKPGAEEYSVSVCGGRTSRRTSPLVGEEGKVSGQGKQDREFTVEMQSNRIRGYLSLKSSSSWVSLNA